VDVQGETTDVRIKKVFNRKIPAAAHAWIWQAWIHKPATWCLRMDPRDDMRDVSFYFPCRLDEESFVVEWDQSLGMGYREKTISFVESAPPSRRTMETDWRNPLDRLLLIEFAHIRQEFVRSDKGDPPGTYFVRIFNNGVLSLTGTVRITSGTLTLSAAGAARSLDNIVVRRLERVE
jgi:hypothetical protein